MSGIVYGPELYVVLAGTETMSIGGIVAAESPNENPGERS
jgi:hypothetical protein